MAASCGVGCAHGGVTSPGGLTDSRGVTAAVQRLSDGLQHGINVGAKRRRWEESERRYFCLAPLRSPTKFQAKTLFCLTDVCRYSWRLLTRTHARTRRCVHRLCGCSDGGSEESEREVVYFIAQLVCLSFRKKASERYRTSDQTERE